MPHPHILVVDDDPKFVHFISEVLIGAGYEVHAASDFWNAVAIAEEVKPVLAILDIAMPGKDGLELARELQSKPATRDIRLMFLTARPVAEDGERAKHVGGAAYLQKPARTASILWTVKVLLGHTQATPERDGMLPA